MKAERNNKLIGALVSIVLGIMFCVLKGGVISTALTIIGAVAIIMGIVDLANKRTTPGFVKAVVGVCVIVFGWMFVDIALYLVAAVLLIQGLTQIVAAVKNKATNNAIQKVIAAIRPLACVVAGVCLLFNKGGTVDWIFILTGILMTVDGVLALADCKK